MIIKILNYQRKSASILKVKIEKLADPGKAEDGGGGENYDYHRTSPTSLEAVLQLHRVSHG